MLVVLNSRAKPSTLRIAEILLEADVSFATEDSLHEHLVNGTPDGLILGGTNVPASEHPGNYEKQARLAQEGTIPVLGICGGHQILALLFGSRVAALPQPLYGRTRCWFSASEPLFEGVPTGTTVLSKHRYVVSEVPPGVEVVARHETTGDIYGARYSPWALGVQFHPERRSETRAVLRNFLAQATAVSGRTP